MNDYDDGDCCAGAFDGFGWTETSAAHPYGSDDRRPHHYDHLSRSTGLKSRSTLTHNHTYLMIHV